MKGDSEAPSTLKNFVIFAVIVIIVGAIAVIALQLGQKPGDDVNKVNYCGKWAQVGCKVSAGILEDQRFIEVPGDKTKPGLRQFCSDRTGRSISDFGETDSAAWNECKANCGQICSSNIAVK
ncbi:MAG: hypothetical protein HY362_03735 [Candidatus Aenigmarchaeota archaeon]|nr:hypothetical protein [Candidatus Aenigmarchaeota archaeon]